MAIVYLLSNSKLFKISPQVINLHLLLHVYILGVLVVVRMKFYEIMWIFSVNLNTLS